MKKVFIIVLATFVMVFAIVVGNYIYNLKWNKKEKSSIEKVSEAEIFDECTDEYETIKNETIVTDTNDEKISPNASIVFKRYYSGCGHEMSSYVEVTEDLVNKTREEIKEKYKDWEIEKFSSSEIVLNKNENGNCGEHFVVREEGGRIIIFQIKDDTKEEIYEVAKKVLEKPTIHILKSS